MLVSVRKNIYIYLHKYYDAVLFYSENEAAKIQSYDNISNHSLRINLNWKKWLLSLSSDYLVSLCIPGGFLCLCHGPEATEAFVPQHSKIDPPQSSISISQQEVKTPSCYSVSDCRSFPLCRGHITREGVAKMALIHE